MADELAVIDNDIGHVIDVTAIDADVYNSIVRSAQLLSIQLIESEFVIVPTFFSDESGKLDLNFCDLHSSFDEESKITTSIFQFECFKKKGRKRVFSLKDKFAVFYRFAEDCDEIHATAFSRKTGVMACYPYFRSHMSQTASLANADMPILPTISTPPVSKERKVE